MHRMFAAGRLRLHWIEYEGRPVAIEYGLTGGDTVYVYQSGFDPEFAKLKVGWMNTILSLQSAIDEGYRGYDWLRGDEPYKASWGGQKRPLVEVRVVGRHNSGAISASPADCGKHRAPLVERSDVVHARRAVAHASECHAGPRDGLTARHAKQRSSLELLEGVAAVGVLLRQLAVSTPSRPA